MSGTLRKHDACTEKYVYEHTCMVSDLRAGAQTVVESAWKLLENLVNRLEPSTQSNSVLHRAVASKLISLGAFLPSWLVTGYKVRATICEKAVLVPSYSTLRTTS